MFRITAFHKRTACIVPGSSYTVIRRPFSMARCDSITPTHYPLYYLIPLFPYKITFNTFGYFNPFGNYYHNKFP